MSDGDNHNNGILSQEENSVGKNVEECLSGPAGVNNAKGRGPLGNFPQRILQRSKESGAKPKLSFIKEVLRGFDFSFGVF